MRLPGRVGAESEGVRIRPEDAQASGASSRGYPAKFLGHESKKAA